MPQKVKFHEGEQLLCYHGPLLYEAKCVKLEVKEKVVKYLVHYNGWNKSWDEWVTESRILKLNDAGLQKQKDLQQEHSTKNRAARLKEKEFLKEKEKEPLENKSKNGSKPTTPQASLSTLSCPPLLTLPSKSDKKTIKVEDKATTPSVMNPVSHEKSIYVDNSRKKRLRHSDALNETETLSEPQKKKRLRIDSNVESEESYKTHTEVNITIPDNLKPWLVDDWDLVTRQRQIVELPARTSVQDILMNFKNNKSEKLVSLDNDDVKELILGLQAYFNVMLGTKLLYKVERPQYADILKKFSEKPLCEIYGAPHFLRLFVKLGGMLAYSSLDEKSLNLLEMFIQDVLGFLSENVSRFFSLQDYVVAPPEHHRKAL